MANKSIKFREMIENEKYDIWRRIIRNCDSGDLGKEVEVTAEKGHPFIVFAAIKTAYLGILGLSWNGGWRFMNNGLPRYT